MKIEQQTWTKKEGWSLPYSDNAGSKAQLVFLFGDRFNFEKKEIFYELQKKYPNAHLIGCSTAGEIFDTKVLEDSLVTTAVFFENTPIKMSHIKISDSKNSFLAGKNLAQSLDHKNLTHVFVICGGLKINGSELVRGLQDQLPPDVGLTGGMAGDALRFEETLICSGNLPEKENAVVLGFYGSSLKVGYGSMGGFSPFGPERLVTKADGNVLYELGGRSALELYKEYLGEERSKDLSTNHFLFPLSYRTDDMKNPVVRTILSINEKDQSMTFAGDISEGGYARLMKTNLNRLVDGASNAAQISLKSLKSASPDLAILISCVGRKIIMKQRVEEETEIVREVLGSKTVLTGFYSYGEIAHFSPFEPCNLHNQTMTITVFQENIPNA